jgi:hypothetical protein
MRRFLVIAEERIYDGRIQHRELMLLLLLMLMLLLVLLTSHHRVRVAHHTTASRGNETRVEIVTSETIVSTTKVYIPTGNACPVARFHLRAAFTATHIHSSHVIVHALRASI